MAYIQKNWPDRVSMKKKEALADLGIAWKSSILCYSQISLKDPLQRLDKALTALGLVLVGSVGVTHSHAGVECGRWGSNDKIGGKATLPLVLQWRGAGGAALSSLSPPSSGVRSTRPMISVESEYDNSSPELITHCRLLCYMADDPDTRGAP